MKHVMVIAEAGVNHNGDLSTAKKLVDIACEAKADAIKFQTFHAESLAVSGAKKAEYQIKNTRSEKSQFEMLKDLELSQEEFKEIFSYCDEKKITFLSSPFDEESADFLDKLGQTCFKIPSGEITNYSYLKKIASYNKDIILSTGMSTLEEIKEALKVLEENEKEKKCITLLHCTSAYPTPMKEVNLNAMLTLESTFHKRVGFSDHTMGMEASIAAVALGAFVIEKHITLDRNLAGPDHKMSMEPEELKCLVRAIRNIEQALGDGIKRPTENELRTREFVRKSLVAAKIIKKGDIFTKDNLCAKRAGAGISPMKLNQILGTISNRDYKIDERIDV